MGQKQRVRRPGRSAPKTSDVVGTSIIAAVGLGAVVMGLGYGVTGPDGSIGPGFMPVITGAFISLASLADIGRLYFAPAGQSTAGLGSLADELSAEAAAAQDAARAELAGDADGEARDTFGRTARQRTRTVLLIFGALLAAILMTQVVGMLLALGLMMFAIVVGLEKKPLVPATLTTVAVVAGAYLIFVRMLGVPLPQGMLGLL